MNAEYKGEIHSFYSLIDKFRIEIPIIQRDYAQGRKGVGEIRRNFLQALRDSFSDKKGIMLDFIYGSRVDDAFQPLDGQQRLTTLFLLYLYIFKKERKPHDFLNKFSYETRISSRDFCAALVKNEINFQQEIKLSEIIIDSPWFFLSWKKDPTIDAMLRTLDDIDNFFRNEENLFENLSSFSDCFIKFYCVELENIGLTDDLYIKMNARGKLLTAFENFKASFQKRIYQNLWEYGLSFESSFAQKIDTEWTDFFWKNFRKNNKIDDAFINFFSTMAMIRQSVNRERVDLGEDRVSIINRLHEDAVNIKTKYFEKSDFDYLVSCLELYSNRYDEIISIGLDLPFWRHGTTEAFINEVVNGGASYTQKVLFFAQTEYFLRVKEVNKEKYLDWMRIVRNIVSRGDVEKTGKRPDIIRSHQTFDGVVNLISDMASGCMDILSFLSSDVAIRSTFARDQVEEERIKAKLTADNSQRKQYFRELEDTDLLRGRIDFILYCLDFDKAVQNVNDNLLGQISNVMTANFNDDMEVSNDLRRALLTIEVDGVYEFYGYWWSSWSVIKSDKRCLIDKFREIEYFISSDYKEYFKKLILNLASGNTLKDLADNFVAPYGFPNWKNRLIKESELLDEKCKSNYIAIPEDNSCCYLLKSKRPRDEDGCEKIE